ncbi:MAG: hypothetical protein R2826_00455 [Thermoleophilia bacterium]
MMRTRNSIALAFACALIALAVVGCGALSPDPNEPNDEPGTATTLHPGLLLDGVIGSADTDVFAASAPGGENPHPFVVIVRAEAPQDLTVQVGASIPGVWEGITWPGWPVTTGDGELRVAGQLTDGTVIIVVTGVEGTVYTVEIDWE